MVARLALRLVPMEASTAVIQVPMLVPNRTKAPLARGMMPALARVWTMPTAAAEDWMMAVKPAPTRMPTRGLEKVETSSTNSGESRRGDMAALIMSMPMNSTPRPARIWPMCCIFVSFTKTMSTTPTKANRGARAPTSRAMSIPVMVVPMLAPMMIQTAWFSVIMPALTKPTTMTVVAEEDWMAAVMAAPTRTPMNRLAVRRSRRIFILAPAAASRPELVICIP